MALASMLLSSISINQSPANILNELVQGHALLSLRTEGWKVVYNFETKETNLFHLHEDPGEQHPIALDPSHPEFEKAGEMFRLRESILALGKALPMEGQGDRRELDPETMQRLKTLGYME